MKKLDFNTLQDTYNELCKEGLKASTDLLRLLKDNNISE